MERISEININNEGLIYINSNLKLNAIKVALHRKLLEKTSTLLNTLSACENDQCLQSC